MPRYIFPASSVTNTTGAPIRLAFHYTQTGGVRASDLWTLDGSNYLSAGIPNGIVLTDAAGAYSAFAGPDDVDTLWVTPHTGAARTQITATSCVSGETFYAQKVAAPTGVAATDIAALTTAYNALPSTGGSLYLQPGTHNWTSGFTFSKPVHLVGVALDDGRIDAVNSGAGGTQVVCTSATAVVLTLAAHGCHIEGIAFRNTAGSTPSAGAAINITSGDRTKIHDCSFDGFYNNVYFNDGSFWEFHHNQVYNAVSYGLRAAHVDLPDGGDWTCHDNVFISGTRSAASSEAIHWASGGGAKIHGNKIVGNQWKYGVSILCDSISTSVILITDNSIEGFLTAGVIVKVLNSGSLGLVTITGNEIAGQPNPGNIVHVENAGGGLYNVHISGNNIFGGSQATGIYAKNVSRFTIGTNQIDTCGQYAVFLDGTCLKTAVAPQGATNCGTLIRDNNPYSDSSNSEVSLVDHRYRRSLGTVSSSSSYTTFFNVDQPTYSGQILEVTVTAILQGVGPAFLQATRVVTCSTSGTLSAATVGTDVTAGAAIDIQFSLTNLTVAVGIRRNAAAGGTALNGSISVICKGAVAKVSAP